MNDYEKNNIEESAQPSEVGGTSTLTLSSRKSISADDLRNTLKRAFSRRPSLAKYFKDHEDHNFWVWANTTGAFLDDDLRDALPPVPPPQMMLCGNEPREFVCLGAGHYSEMQRVLNQIGRSWETSLAVLDFGCGSGRTSRFFAKNASYQRFVGYDLTAGAIDWLRSELGFGDFQVGFANPPLPIEDSSMDVIFSVSVFSHLTAESQQAWLEEFRRVLRPDGIVFQTVHGRFAMERCKKYECLFQMLSVSPEHFATLDRQLKKVGFGWVPHISTTVETCDYGMAFHSEEYITSQWTNGYELIGIWPGRIDNWQDLVALRRSDIVRIYPIWPEKGLAPVEKVTLSCYPEIQEPGQPLLLKASACGGRDVHYKFFTAETETLWRPISDWQESGQLEYVVWIPGEVDFTVSAASGRGIHTFPDAEAGFRVTISETLPLPGRKNGIS